MKHLNQSLNIRQRSLSLQHSNFVITYENTGLVQEKKSELKEALINFQKAATINHYSLPSEHLEMIEIKKCIQGIASKLR
jgi:hypothetical protein